MSRFDCEYDGETWDWVRWQGAKKQAFSSAYGKERLRELEAALLALPNKRLIEGSLIEAYEPPTGWAPLFEWGTDHVPESVEPGDVCVMGAYIAYKMGEGDIAVGLARLLESELPDLDYRSDYHTADMGREQGMRYTMAWEIGFMNDETLGGMTPEERYGAALVWVRARIERGAERGSWY